MVEWQRERAAKGASENKEGVPGYCNDVKALSKSASRVKSAEVTVREKMNICQKDCY